MKYNKLHMYIWLLSFLIIGLSCRKQEVKSSCDPSSTSFQSIFQNMTLNGHTDDVHYDTEIHEYTFVLSQEKEVCELGYQSQPATSSVPYLIEIIDNATSTIIYGGNHIFSSSETSFVTPPLTIALQTGISYTLRRTILLNNANGQLGNIIGRVARKDQMNFPYSEGIMTVTDANFYQTNSPTGGSLQDVAVPYIDLVFRD